MRARFFGISLLLLMLVGTIVWGQTVEMAVRCEAATNKLAELVKNKDPEEAAKILGALGLAVLDSCDVPQGTVTCFQCLDKDQKLRSVQILRDSRTGRFTFNGFGCRCGEEKK
jgi:hypothetical protein